MAYEDMREELEEKLDEKLEELKEDPNPDPKYEYNYKNIKVKEKTYDKIVKIKGYLEVKSGKKRTFSDAIDTAIETSSVYKKVEKVD